MNRQNIEDPAGADTRILRPLPHIHPLAVGRSFFEACALSDARSHSLLEVAICASFMHNVALSDASVLILHGLSAQEIIG